VFRRSPPSWRPHLPRPPRLRLSPLRWWRGHLLVFNVATASFMAMRRRIVARSSATDRTLSPSQGQGTCSVSAAELEVLTLFRRFSTAAQASAPGTTAQVSSSAPPSGTSSPWFLDSSTSFHMTPHSTHLSSMSSLDPPLFVRTADGTSLPDVFFRHLLLMFLLFRMFPNSPCNCYLRVKSLIMVVA